MNKSEWPLRVESVRALDQNGAVASKGGDEYVAWKAGIQSYTFIKKKTVGSKRYRNTVLDSTNQDVVCCPIIKHQNYVF